MAREAAEALAKQKELEREEELRRIAEEKRLEEAELDALDWKKPTFNLSHVVLAMLHFKVASKVRRRRAGEDRKFSIASMTVERRCIVWRWRW